MPKNGEIYDLATLSGHRLAILEQKVLQTVFQELL